MMTDGQPQYNMIKQQQQNSTILIIVSLSQINV